MMSMRADAAYALTPHCPKCFQALPTPDWWTNVEPRGEEWFKPVTVHCANCKHTVMARFYGGGMDR